MVKIQLFDIISLYKKFTVKVFLLLRFILLPYYEIEENIPKKGTILDVGCGFGLYSIYFALKEKNRKVIGLELNKNRVIVANEAAKKIKNISFQERNLVEDTSLKNADCICINDVLHHIPYSTQKTLITECYKRLKKNGVILIKDSDKKPLWKYWYSIIHDKVMTLNDPLYFFYSKDLEKYLKEIGFKVVKNKRIKTWPFNLNPVAHYMLIAKK